MRQSKTFPSLYASAASFRRISDIRPCAVAILVAALLASGLALGPGAALATTIDDFTETAIVGLNVIAPSLTFHSAMGLASVAGGDRTIELAVTAATNLANNVAFAIDTSGIGEAVYSSGPIADGDLSLLYDGMNLAADLGLVVDTIKVNFIAFDDGFSLGMDVTVVISDGANTADLTLPLIGSSMVPFEIPFDFSGFAAVDRASLTSIEVIFEAMQGQDFVLDSIHAATVPEPATMTLLGLGAAMATGAYRVRRRS